MKGIEYYARRLGFIMSLFFDHQSELLDQNKDRIRVVIDKYRRFKGDPNYDPNLISQIETFIL